MNLNDDGFHPLVEVVLFNQTFKAVIDTGASRTVLDKTTIETHVDETTLLISDKLSTGLGTNSMESYTLPLDQIRIGELLINDIEVAVLDLSTINTAYETLSVTPVIGVIGGDILVRYNAIINYPLKKISFSYE
ncbi:aspartyl protease family protein [Arcticibacter sp.]|uniref:aspartyl protease family protein n=1 Tax=Arcticibacter sp. TaxID=1872630 RepID=UPI00388EBFB3